MYATIHDEMLSNVEHLDKDTQARVIYAYVDYQLHGTIPDSSDTLVYSIFMAKKFDLDAIISRANASRANGMLWWAPKGNSNAGKTWEKVSKQPSPNLEQPRGNLEQPIEREIERKVEIENKNKTNMCNWTLHDTPSFDEFWDLYPNKKDKKKAREKFSKLSADKRQLAIDGISRLMKSEQWMRWFIPLPTTYLNGERWEDEVGDSSSSLAKNQALERERSHIREQYLSSIESSDVWLENKAEAFDRRWEVLGS